MKTLWITGVCALTLMAALMAATTALAQSALPDYMAKMDRDKDGKISGEEWVADRPGNFKRIDANGDKSLTVDEVNKFYLAIAPMEDPKTARRISGITSADSNADSKVTLEELTAYGLADFKKRDVNADGFITGDDLKK